MVAGCSHHQQFVTAPSPDLSTPSPPPVNAPEQGSVGGARPKERPPPLQPVPGVSTQTTQQIQEHSWAHHPSSFRR
jgi:hypothetical protein